MIENQPAHLIAIRSNVDYFSELKLFREHPYSIFQVQNSGLGKVFNQSMIAWDTDNNGVDELFFTQYDVNHAELIKYEASSGSLQVQLTIPLGKTKSILSFQTIPFQVDNDPNFELVATPDVTYPYPGKGLFRGFYALDMEDQQVHWFYPTSHYVRNMITLTSSIAQGQILVSCHS